MSASKGRRSRCVGASSRPLSARTDALCPDHLHAWRLCRLPHLRVRPRQPFPTDQLLTFAMPCSYDQGIANALTQNKNFYEVMPRLAEDSTILGTVLALFVLGAAAGTLTMSAIGNRVGRRPLILFATFATLVGAGGMAGANGLACFCVMVCPRPISASSFLLSLLRLTKPRTALNQRFRSWNAHRNRPDLRWRNLKAKDQGVHDEP